MASTCLATKLQVDASWFDVLLSSTMWLSTANKISLLRKIKQLASIEWECLLIHCFKTTWTLTMRPCLISTARRRLKVASSLRKREKYVRALKEKVCYSPGILATRFWVAFGTVYPTIIREIHWWLMMNGSHLFGIWSSLLMLVRIDSITVLYWPCIVRVVLGTLRCERLSKSRASTKDHWSVSK